MINALLIRWLLRIGSSLMGTVAFSVLFGAPKKEWVWCGMTGCLGWLIYCIFFDLGTGNVMANFIATASLTVLSWIMAYLRRCPVTMFLIPGIFPLVPGAGIYYTAYYFVMGQPEIGAAKAIETIQTAGAISVGIMLGQALTAILLRKHFQRIS